jgi:hypothetical protein
LAQGTIKEYQRDPSPLEFVNQHYLVSIFASQAVWRVNVQPLYLAGGYCIAKAFQSWSYQCRAAVSAVDELVLR